MLLTGVGPGTAYSQRNIDFVLEETACLAVKASWESKDVCVGSWGLEPETDRAEKSGQGRVPCWSMSCEGLRI